jgi:hypothetical protein
VSLMKGRGLRTWPNRSSGAISAIALSMLTHTLRPHSLRFSLRRAKMVPETVFPEGDKLEVAVKTGRGVLMHLPARPRPGVEPLRHPATKPLTHRLFAAHHSFTVLIPLNCGSRNGWPK